MTTSNTYSYGESTYTVVNDAYSFLGVLQEGDSGGLTPFEYQLGVRTLNRISKSIQVKNDRAIGMKMWLRQVGFCFLDSNQGQYTLSTNVSNLNLTTNGQWTNQFDVMTSGGGNAKGANLIHLSSNVGSLSNTPIATNNYVNIVLDNNTMFTSQVQSVSGNTINLTSNITSTFNFANPIYFFSTPAQPPQVVDWVTLRDSNGNDSYINVLTYEEYSALAARGSPIFIGIPSAVYYESHLTTGSGGFGLLNTDVTGSSDLTRYLVVNYTREIQDWVNPNDEPDFPKEWFLALVHELAFQLHPHFSVVWTPSMETLRVQSLLLAQGANPKKLSYKFSRTRQPGYKVFPHR